MKKILGLSAALLLLAISPLHAQSTPPLATVVTACGTPPSTYTAGTNRPILQDANGNQCGNATVGTVTAITTITNPVGVKGGDGSTITSASNPLTVTISPLTSGGLSTFSANITTAGTGAGTGGVAVKTTPGQLYGYMLWNGNSSVCYLQVFDATQATTNLGTTVPKLSIGIPALGGANLALPIGIPFATAITFGVTTTRSGSTACSTGIDVNATYN